MNHTLQPKTAIQPTSVAPSLSAFLELAFRPLYLLSAIWALSAIGLWIYAPQLLSGPLAGIAWHAHEMLWGFVGTVAVAFLMTAGANWTGINPLKGGALALVSVLWLIARVGFLAGGQHLYLVAAASELGFFLLAAVAMMRSVYRARNARNYAVPWLLVGLSAADALYLRAARGGDYVLLMQRFNVGLLVMALIALLIVRRVIPFFASQAVKGLTVPARTHTGHVQLAACVAGVIFLLADLTLPYAVALAIAGTLALWQLMTWKPYAIRRIPLVWILYVGYAGLGVGLSLAALRAAGVTMPPALPVHMISIGGFSVLIIGMMTRTALGHLGRPLATDASMVASYVLMLIALALRLVALVSTRFNVLTLQLSAAAWMAVFSLYLWRFAPLLIRPRK